MIGDNSLKCARYDVEDKIYDEIRKLIIKWMKTTTK